MFVGLQFYLGAKMNPEPVHDQKQSAALVHLQEQTHQSQLDVVFLWFTALLVRLHCKSFRKG